MNTVNREKIVVVEEYLEIDAMKERESDRELGVPLERREVHVKVNRMMRPERNHGNMNFSATATPATQKNMKISTTTNMYLR